MATKIGEVQVKMTSNVKKSEELFAIIRAHTVDKTKEIAFKPSVDLAEKDTLKITIEKV